MSLDRGRFVGVLRSCSTFSDYGQLATPLNTEVQKTAKIGGNRPIFSRCPHNMANFGPLTADIGSRVWGAPAKFNGFRVLASLLHRRHPPEVNQTLHDLWPSPGLVHHIYIFGGSYPLTEFCHVQNSLCVQILRFPILAPLLHGTPAVGSAKVCGVVQGMKLPNCRRGAGATYIRLGGHHVRHRPTF